MQRFNPPWRDPIADPPDEYSEVIVTTETGRVTSVRYARGRWSTYTPILCWMPMPPAGKEIQGESAELPANPKAAPKKRMIKRKTKV